MLIFFALFFGIILLFYLLVQFGKLKQETRKNIGGLGAILMLIGFCGTISECYRIYDDISHKGIGGILLCMGIGFIGFLMFGLSLNSLCDDELENDNRPWWWGL